MTMMLISRVNRSMMARSVSVNGRVSGRQNPTTPIPTRPSGSGVPVDIGTNRPIRMCEPKTSGAALSSGALLVSTAT